MKIAFVGRPNVGKSSLFNRIAGRRVSIVHEMEGVTRDRIVTTIDFFGEDIDLIDTGGICQNLDIPYAEKIREQADFAIAEANAIVMIVDGKAGLIEQDHSIAKMLLKSGKRVVLAVNKVDSLDDNDILIAPFYRLGIDDIIPVSASHGHQMVELIEKAKEGVVVPDEEPKEEELKVAIIGRANVGKSTLINHILGEPRCMVSDVLGTTRDRVHVPVEIDGKKYTIVDTAGIRRRHKESDVIEKFAAMRTKDAIRDAQVCLLVIDSDEGLTMQEKRIATEVLDAGKGLILCFNKWDLVKKTKMEHYLHDMRIRADFMEFCPSVFMSGLTGRNVFSIFKTVDEVYAESKKRISTGALNQFLESAMQRCHPQMIKGKRLRVYYMTQVKSEPPFFTMFVNSKDLLSNNYKKYLINQMRKSFQFTGLPIQFAVRGKVKKERIKR